jgi:hypothetical protein
MFTLTRARVLRLLLAATLAPVGIAVATAGPAQAYAVDQFDVCGNTCAESRTAGTITWHNRTATIQGYVLDAGTGFTRVTFYPYAGSRSLPEQSRTANDSDPAVGARRSFNFVIGDTDLPGGINTINIVLCKHDLLDPTCWSAWENRDH